MPDAGVPALREHLASVTTIMKLADEWQRFMNKLDRVHPRFNTTLLLPFKEPLNLIEARRRDYNQNRPHSSISDMTPDEFAAKHSPSREAILNLG